MPLTLGQGVGRHRVIAWGGNNLGAFGVHASAASADTLTVGDPIMGHLGLAVTLAQSVVMPVANATQGHLAQNIYTLGVANGTLGHTVVVPTETQLHILVVVDGGQGYTATPIILVKELVVGSPGQEHSADPVVLVKNVLEANASMGHEGTALQMTLTVDSASMGHNGLAVAFGGAASNLTVVAGTMPHDGLSVEGFSPTQLADLKLWLAPESGVIVSGNLVEQWNDKSGLNNHAATPLSANMPFHVSGVFAGHNAVEFRVAARRIYAENVAAVCAMSQSAHSPMSGVIVAKTSTLAANQRAWVMGATSALGQHVRTLIYTNAGKLTLQEATTATGVTANTFGSASTSPQVIRWSWNSGVAHAWTNGAQVLVSGRLSAAGHKNLGASAHIVLGAVPGDASVPFQGQIVEILLAATAWTSSQGRELDKLLGAKYGITIT